MCEYCGRDYEGVLKPLPLKKVSGEGVLKSYIRRNTDIYEIVFKLENGEYTLKIDNCPMCEETLEFDKVYYIKTEEGYICENMSKKTGKLKVNADKNYAFPCPFKSLAEFTAAENNGEIIEEELFTDEFNELFSRFSD